MLIVERVIDGRVAMRVGQGAPGEPILSKPVSIALEEKVEDFERMINVKRVEEVHQGGRRNSQKRKRETSYRVLR